MNEGPAAAADQFAHLRRGAKTTAVSADGFRQGAHLQRDGAAPDVRETGSPAAPPIPCASSAISRESNAPAMAVGSASAAKSPSMEKTPSATIRARERLRRCLPGRSLRRAMPLCRKPRRTPKASRRNGEAGSLRGVGGLAGPAGPGEAQSVEQFRIPAAARIGRRQQLRADENGPGAGQEAKRL